MKTNLKPAGRLLVITLVLFLLSLAGTMEVRAEAIDEGHYNANLAYGLWPEKDAHLGQFLIAAVFSENAVIHSTATSTLGYMLLDLDEDGTDDVGLTIDGEGITFEILSTNSVSKPITKTLTPEQIKGIEADSAIEGVDIEYYSSVTFHFDDSAFNKGSHTLDLSFGEEVSDSPMPLVGYIIDIVSEGMHVEGRITAKGDPVTGTFLLDLDRNDTWDIELFPNVTYSPVSYNFVWKKLPTNSVADQITIPFPSDRIGYMIDNDMQFFSPVTFIMTRRISDVTVAAIPDQTYTGSAIKPAVTAKYGSDTLKAGTDYDAEYKDNINAGTASVTLKGKGQYTGTKTVTFKIVKPAPDTGKDTDKDTDPKADAPITAEVTRKNPVSLAAVTKTVTAITNDKKDAAGSTFSLLQAKGDSKSNISIKLSWKKVTGAARYVIYGNKCGKKNKYEEITSVTKRSFTQTKLKKGTYYKYIVVAVDKSDQAIAVSKTVHVATKGGKGKKGNATSVKLNVKSKITLKKGKAKKLKCTVKYGKLKGAVHRKPAWESGNPAVATVTASGKVKAVAKGSSYIYAYAQNGKMARVKVIVK